MVETSTLVGGHATLPLDRLRLGGLMIPCTPRLHLERKVAEQMHVFLSDPIESVSAPTLACNNDGNSGPNQLVATITYPAKCPRTTCTGVNANGLKWFKIDEAGLLSGTVNSGTWAAKKMITDNSTWTSTIPASAPSGPYLIRHETIALHSMPAQHYPECAELLITDGGNLEPTPDELVTPVG
ncbi:glycoside hydrolase [Coprinellus micaceus]|uniref:lytic cellulose monooxygenase (C4-dehydrogenating) n=1 Tax=Coprinellus micaceus TaxID=71717 RepID=A0A4Y7TCI3_COPMI|nr:glycoside hydrolase [Coprinellus micaceus]